MERVTVDLRFGLGGGAFALGGFSSSFGGSNWVSVIQDWRLGWEPIVVDYGIQGTDPTDCIADAGTCSFPLNNRQSNTARTRGWYSPLNAIKRGGFDFNIPVQLILTYNGVNYYKFYGSLADIAPTPGKFDDGLVRCTAVDIMDDYARLPVPALDIQLNKRLDELAQLIIDAAPVQPATRSVETGLETYAIAFDRNQDEEITIREALHDLCMSELATMTVVGTIVAPGGLFKVRNRHSSALNPLVEFSFDNDLGQNAIVVPGSRDDLVTKLQVFVHPSRVDSSPVILFDLQTTTTLVGPGQSYAGLFGPYRDPDNPGDRVGGKNMIAPVATTDYTMNSAQDGSGTDLTANFTVAASFTAAGVRFTITNNGAAAGYVTKLQCRGLGIYRYEAVIEKDIDTQYGQRALQVDMAYQNSTNVGDDVATYLASVLSHPLARVSALTFLANVNADRMNAALQREPGDRIAISDSTTGLDAAEFTIQHVHLEIEKGGRYGQALYCTWGLIPADTQRYWLLGSAGASELGVSTTLGF